MIKNNTIRIGNGEIGSVRPVYILAEMSANHNQNFDQAVQLIKAAKESGADAIKLQTYTPDTITIDCDNEYFRIGKGTIWEGKNLYQLYKDAYTPWEWQPKLKKIALLKCTSSYPAKPEEMNLHTIPHMADTFGVPVGLSDHTLGIAVPVAAVALGACIVEKHFTLSRSTPCPDSTFSLEPQEFKAMVDAIRTTEKALGDVSYKVTKHEAASRIFRRSLFVVKDIKAGEVLTEQNIRSIRPGYGLHTRFLNKVIGGKAKIDIKCGTPLDLEMLMK